MRLIYSGLLVVNFLIFTPEFFTAQAQQSGADLLQKLKSDIDLGVKYLSENQIHETIEGKKYVGEWPVKMGLRTGFFLLGSNLDKDDSNCFSTATIHNGLVRIFLLYPDEYRDLIPIIDASYIKILSYKNKHAFNFWNALPPYRKLLKTDTIGKQPLVRRPTNYPLKSKYINQAANITEDADDTSLGFMSIMWRQKLNDFLKRKDTLNADIPDTLFTIFDSYRDTLRKNRHWYNYINGNNHNTGAYLTWLGEEYAFKRWNIFKVMGHNVIFYLPSSECYPHPYVPYIPYGTNDLDAVVNANVLACIQMHGSQHKSAGFQSSVRYITHKAKRKKSYFRAGVYYPNTYHFPYAVCLAFASGVDPLKTATVFILEFIKSKQRKDGSWLSRRIVNKHDPIQSTVYALAALVYASDLKEKTNLEIILKALKYLDQKKKYTDSQMYLKGGVFFSGGTVVRNTLFWKSDAYTTLIYIQSLAYLRKKIESGQTCIDP